MADFKVTAPQPFTGEIAGVSFHKGEATANRERDRAALSYFRRHGYSVEPVIEDEPEQPAEEPQDDSSALFNPSEHNAEDVIAYLDSLDEDDEGTPAERERVLAAERAGKDRKTIAEKGGASS